MKRWVVAIAAVLASLAPGQAAHAQAPNACQNLIFQAVFPMLQAANNFGPSGVYPAGFAPLVQPFATNPAEYSLYGYPGVAYYGGYAARVMVPPGMPYGLGSLVPPAPAAPLPDPASVVAPPPEPLTAAGIMRHLIESGAWERLSATDQAEWLVRLSNIQRDQQRDLFFQYLGLANLQREAQRDLANIRRIPFDLAERYQERLSDWRFAYAFSADSLRNLLAAVCSPTTGQIGVGPVPAGAPFPVCIVGQPPFCVR